MSISIAGSMDPQKAPKHVAVDSPCTTQLLIATWKYDAVMEVDGRHKELIQEPEFCFSPSQRIPKISTHHLGMGSNPYCKKNAAVHTKIAGHLWISNNYGSQMA